MNTMEKSFRYLVRIAQTDLDGNKKVVYALRRVKGVSFMFANLACNLAAIDPEKRAGILSDAEIEKLQQVLSKGFGLFREVVMGAHHQEPDHII